METQTEKTINRKTDRTKEIKQKDRQKKINIKTDGSK